MGDAFFPPNKSVLENKQLDKYSKCETKYLVLHSCISFDEIELTTLAPKLM